MSWRAGPGDYNLDCRICLETDYFNNSLRAEYSSHPGRALSTEGTAENKARPGLWNPGFCSQPYQHILFLFLGFNLLLCTMRGLGNLGLRVSGVIVRLWKDSDIFYLNRPPAGGSSSSIVKRVLESLHSRLDITHNSLGFPSPASEPQVWQLYVR